MPKAREAEELLIFVAGVRHLGTGPRRSLVQSSYFTEYRSDDWRIVRQAVHDPVPAGAASFLLWVTEKSSLPRLPASLGDYLMQHRRFV